jgi:hypothetical protein
MWDGRQPARTESVEHESRGIYSIGSRYQATIGEDTEDCDDLVRAVVNCEVHNLVKLLQF